MNRKKMIINFASVMIMLFFYGIDFCEGMQQQQPKRPQRPTRQLNIPGQANMQRPTRQLNISDGLKQGQQNMGKGTPTFKLQSSPPPATTAVSTSRASSTRDSGRSARLVRMAVPELDDGRQSYVGDPSDVAQERFDAVALAGSMQSTEGMVDSLSFYGPEAVKENFLDQLRHPEKYIGLPGRQEISLSEYSSSFSGNGGLGPDPNLPARGVPTQIFKNENLYTRLFDLGLTYEQVQGYLPLIDHLMNTEGYSLEQIRGMDLEEERLRRGLTSGDVSLRSSKFGSEVRTNSKPEDDALLDALLPVPAKLSDFDIREDVIALEKAQEIKKAAKETLAKRLDKPLSSEVKQQLEAQIRETNRQIDLIRSELSKKMKALELAITSVSALIGDDKTIKDGQEVFTRSIRQVSLRQANILKKYWELEKQKQKLTEDFRDSLVKNPYKKEELEQFSQEYKGMTSSQRSSRRGKELEGILLKYYSQNDVDKFEKEYTSMSGSQKNGTRGRSLKDILDKSKRKKAAERRLEDLLKVKAQIQLITLDKIDDGKIAEEEESVVYRPERARDEQAVVRFYQTKIADLAGQLGSLGGTFSRDIGKIREELRRVEQDIAKREHNIQKSKGELLKLEPKLSKISKSLFDDPEHIDLNAVVAAGESGSLEHFPFPDEKDLFYIVTEDTDRAILIFNKLKEFLVLRTILEDLMVTRDGLRGRELVLNGSVDSQKLTIKASLQDIISDYRSLSRETRKANPLNLMAFRGTMEFLPIIMAYEDIVAIDKIEKLPVMPVGVPSSASSASSTRTGGGMFARFNQRTPTGTTSSLSNKSQHSRPTYRFHAKEDEIANLDLFKKELGAFKQYFRSCSDPHAEAIQNEIKYFGDSLYSLISAHTKSAKSMDYLDLSEFETDDEIGKGLKEAISEYEDTHVEFHLRQLEHEFRNFVFATSEELFAEQFADKVEYFKVQLERLMNNQLIKDLDSPKKVLTSLDLNFFSIETHFHEIVLSLVEKFNDEHGTSHRV